MNRNKISLSTYIISVLFVTGIVLVPFRVYAENEDLDNNEQEQANNNEEKNEEENDDRGGELRDRIQERQEEREQKVTELKEKRDEVRCKNRERVLENRIKMFEISEKLHRNRYRRVHSRIENLITRLSAQGVDTTTLQGYLDVLKGKLDTLDQQYEDFKTALGALKDTPCPSTEGEFNNSVAEIKRLLAQVRATAEEIKVYFVDTVKPELKALREQLETLKADDPTTEDENSESEN